MHIRLPHKDKTWFEVLWKSMYLAQKSKVQYKTLKCGELVKGKLCLKLIYNIN